MAREQDDLLRRGFGMTSQRTRERLIQRLYDEGLSNAQVLEVIRRTPRHLFVDEALVRDLFTALGGIAAHECLKSVNAVPSRQGVLPGMMA